MAADRRAAEKSSSLGRERIGFGPFWLTPGARLLTREGEPVDIGGRSFDLLVALVEEPGRVIGKGELLERVWPDVTVEDGSLRFHMAALRRILGDGEDGARYIATQVGVGYAFVAPVQRSSAESETELPPPAEASPDGLAAPRSVELPTRLHPLIGRDRDLALLVRRVPETRFVTIVGAGGVGKTTLAIAIGHALAPTFADRVAFVDLGALEDPSLVPSAIASALAIPILGEDPLRVLLGHIRARKLLLVVDNCEHLVDAVAAILERIHDAAPEVAILATSREPLRAHGEQVHRLGSLDYPEDTEGLSLAEALAFPAVELFIDRASSATSTLALDPATVRAIADVCRRLDGMALAIELAAVRGATHGVEATAKLLGERFSLGWPGRRTALPRHQTLEATLDWSYDLLPESERRTLERLSVFVGPFSLEAALDVVTDEELSPDVGARALDALAAKSLLSLVRGRGDTGFRLLEMTRAYARQKLATRGPAELRAACRRHALHFLRLLEDASVDRFGEREGVARLAEQLGNLRGALTWCFDVDGDHEIGVPLASASALVFLNLSSMVECRTWCARACEELPEDQRGTAVELELQAALGLSLMFTRGNVPSAGAALRRALDLAVRLGDRWSQLRLLGRLHIFHERVGEFETALSWATTAVEVAEAIGEPEAIAVAMSLAGISHHLAGDQPRAREELELALRHALPSRRERTILYGFDHRNRSGIALGRTLWLLGHPDRARDVAERTVREAASLDHPVTHCIAMLWMLSIHLWTSDHAKAEALLDTFAHLAEVNALGPYIAASGGLRGQLEVRSDGNVEEAIGAIEESIGRLRAARYELLTTSLEESLVEGLIASGAYDRALDQVDATLARCEENGERLARPELLRLEATAERLRGAPERADELLLESIACSQQQGARAWELRATIDLANSWATQGRTSDALERLRSVREGFSEGATTADLVAADRLLATLALG